jgi:hypothetical protein
LNEAIRFTKKPGFFYFEKFQQQQCLEEDLIVAEGVAKLEVEVARAEFDVALTDIELTKMSDRAYYFVEARFEEGSKDYLKAADVALAEIQQAKNDGKVGELGLDDEDVESVEVYRAAGKKGERFMEYKQAGEATVSKYNRVKVVCWLT